MDDDYDIDDIDDFDSDDDEIDDFLNEDDSDDSGDFETDADLSDIEEAGMMDGSFDSDNNMPLYGSYGASIDEDELSDEEKEAYENGYFSGYNENG